MKKTEESILFNGQILKSYQLNKDVEINIYYNDNTMKSEDIIVMISWDTKTTLEGFNQETLNMTLKQIESLVRAKLYPIVKTELQQIKDILIDTITVEQAEKYSYVAIDKTDEFGMGLALYVDEPKIRVDMWNNSDEGDRDYENLDFDRKNLNDYIETNWENLCFKISDLKGQN